MKEHQHAEWKESWRDEGTGLWGVFRFASAQAANPAHQNRLRFVGPRKGGHWEVL